MKKFFQTLGMLSLICFSFFFSEQTVNVVKEQDDIMKQIKNVADNYKIDPIEAKIENDTIIPGINGRIVNINKSYSEMRRVGSFSENLLSFQEIKPKESINNKYDKYIVSGNTTKNNVTLIFLVQNNNNLSNIIKTIDNKNIKVNFFVDGLWLEKNEQYLTNLYNNKHNIGNLSYNMNYKDSSFVWMNTIIKKVIKQNVSYCYTEEKSKEIIDICNLQKNYTIIPDIVYKDSIDTIKENIKNGSIIAFPYSKKMEKELPVIINYINSKGFNIVTLEELLNEKL